MKTVSSEWRSANRELLNDKKEASITGGFRYQRIRLFKLNL